MTEHARCTKVVATLGPASCSPAAVAALVDAGMDVARVSFSHGRPEDQLALIRLVRAVSGDRPVGVLADLPGPKVRAGAFPAGGAELVEGTLVTLAPGGGGSTGQRLEVVAEAAVEGLQPGDVVAVGDGAIQLRVESADAGEAKARVVRGGHVEGRPGLSLPTSALAERVPTAKDRALLERCVAAGVDMVAVSFVRSAAELSDVCAAAGDDPPMILAKIETAEAVADLEGILGVADGVMVARGDLGIRLPLEDVPHVQKHIIRTSIAAGRPVITATQMLESMITSLSPTRAEVSDVANAVFDGTDALMLSAETAVGVDPPQAVRTMVRVAERAEREADYAQWGAKLGRLRRKAEVPLRLAITDAVSHAAWQAAASVGAAAIVCCSRSGSTARAVARFRPVAPMLAVSPSLRAVRQLSLTWGIRAFPGTERRTTDEIVWHAVEELSGRGLLAKGDVVVVVAGFPHDPEPAADVMRVVRVR
ncbi:MAG: pyruvate kinase [Actinomycetota bacterium]|nr:pyruvate kinase [Actinomycetota bacterium]